jgi:hypothetical protein
MKRSQNSHLFFVVLAQRAGCLLAVPRQNRAFYVCLAKLSKKKVVRRSKFCSLFSLILGWYYSELHKGHWALSAVVSLAL